LIYGQLRSLLALILRVSDPGKQQEQQRNGEACDVCSVHARRLYQIYRGVGTPVLATSRPGSSVRLDRRGTTVIFVLEHTGGQMSVRSIFVFAVALLPHG